jgi:hypothetical protein
MVLVVATLDLWSAALSDGMVIVPHGGEIETQILMRRRIR